MIKSAIEYIASAVSSLKPKIDNPHRDIFGRVIEHGEEFFHPQEFKGIPVFDIETILRNKKYKELLDKLRVYTDIGSHRMTPDGKRNLYDALYTDVIRKYIEYAHLIPASEDHHHAHNGGLIIHSLEVSIASLRYAKEVEVPKTGFSDLDQQLKPVMHYCAWLAGLLHDAGKMMADISVDAVEVIHPLTKRPIPIKAPIPSWRPQKESLTAWALQHNISSYSVSFLNDRKHKRHNTDSAQIMKPILNDTHALDFILDSPLQSETYSELCRVLSGYSSSKDYLSNAVRHGDVDSVGKNIQIDYDRIRGTRVLSTATRIYQCIKNARREWDFNTTNAQGWIIGGDVYLRWTSAIDSIIRVSTELQYSIPTDARNLLTIMESNGLVQMFDKQNRMVKFCPGSFTKKDIPLIVSGQKNIRWVDLFKMRGREMVFGTDPMPDSIEGLFFLPETQSFIIVDTEGLTSVVLSDVSLATPELPNNQQPASGDTKSLPKDTKVSSKKETVTDNEAPAPNKASTDNESSSTNQAEPVETQPKLVELLPKQASVSNIDAINFALSGKAIPAEQSQNEQAESKSKDEQKGKTTQSKKASKSKKSDKTESIKDELVIDGTQSNQDALPKTEDETGIKKPLVCSPVLSTLLDNRVRYHIQNDKCYIDADDAMSITKMDIKDIVSDLEKKAHLRLNLQNPNKKLNSIKVGDETIKAIPVAPALNRFFNYPVAIANTLTQPSHHDTEIPNSQLSEPNQTFSSEKDAPNHTKLSDKETLKKLLSSGARCFVLSGHPHVDVSSATQKLGLSESELIEELKASYLLHIDITSNNDSLVKTIEHEGQSVRTLVLKKRYAKIVSTLPAHHDTSESHDALPVANAESPKDVLAPSYSTDMLFDASANDTLAKFLNSLPEAGDQFFVGGPDHIKVDTLAIVKVMTARKADFPFGQSAFKRIIRKYASGDETVGGITYSCLPNDVFQKIKLSELK